MPSVGPREQPCPGDCCLGPHDIACYCGCRGLCEPFLSNVGLPLLATQCCGKMCLINMLGKPFYGCCDMLCMKDSKDPDRPSGLNAIKAVVVLTVRPVKDVAAYKTAYDKHAKEVQGSTEGVRSMFSFPDKEREGMVLQVGWYDSPEVLAGVPTDAAVEACYTDNEKVTLACTPASPPTSGSPPSYRSLQHAPRPPPRATSLAPAQQGRAACPLPAPSMCRLPAACNLPTNSPRTG